MKPTNHGGRRENAGRPKGTQTGKKTRTISLSLPFAAVNHARRKARESKTTVSKWFSTLVEATML
jgi:hypothetical protein